ncbi:DUF2937 family protein [Rhodobacterales bacterium HKCCE2091]|nr:DUF2937 family protein [Rhodobacterales bacterium HKCCE2091]
MRIVTLVAGLIGAGAFAQFPEYSQQYLQRLAGAVDELGVVVADFDRSAEGAGMDRDEALRALAGNPFLDSRQADMTRTVTRYEALSDDLARMRGAGPVDRLTVMAGGIDRDLAARTLDDFRPAVPVTATGGGFAAAGFAVAALAASGLRRFCTWAFGRRRVVKR